MEDTTHVVVHLVRSAGRDPVWQLLLGGLADLLVLAGKEQVPSEKEVSDRARMVPGWAESRLVKVGFA